MTKPESISSATGPNARGRARAETRTNLVNAGLRLFARLGYDSTSVKQIAQEAGVAQGLLYHYFESKEKLLQAIFQISMEDVRRSFAAAGAIGSSSALEQLIRASFRIVQENQEFWRLSYALRMQPAVLGSLAEPLAEWTTEILGTLERLLRDAGYPAPATEASILFGTIDGIAQHYTMMPATYPLGTIVDALVTRYAGSQKTEAERDTDHGDNLD
ncbi:MAG: TetR/AcrR family transcriptional regulator [Armatimonadota bacterium]